MTRRIQDGCSAVLALSALLLTAPALSQTGQAAPAAQGKAAEPAKKVADPGAKHDPKGDKLAGKQEDKSGKQEDKSGKQEDKSGKHEEKSGKQEDKPGKGDDTVSAVQKREVEEAKVKERLQRRKNEQEAERPKVMAALRGQPMSEALRQELTRHARRLARLERVKSVASEAKDDAAVERASKLIAAENARHDKFTTTAEGKDEKAGAK